MVPRAPDSEERRVCGALSCDGGSRGTRPGWRAPCQSSSSSRPAGHSAAGTERVPGLRTPRTPRRASRADRLPHRFRCREPGSASRPPGSSDNAGARSPSPSLRRTAARRRRRRSPSRSLDNGWSCRRTPYPVPPVRTPRPGLGRIACSPAWAGVERATGCWGRAVGRAFRGRLYTRVQEVYRRPPESAPAPAGTPLARHRQVARVPTGPISRPAPPPRGSWCRSGCSTSGTAAEPRRWARCDASPPWP